MTEIRWKHILIDNSEVKTDFLTAYRNALREGSVLASAFDTETTGLHPIIDVPFLFQCGWLEVHGTTVYGFVGNIEIDKHLNLAKSFIRNWNKLTEHSPLYLGHNVNFDQHMTENIGCRYDKWDNLSDTQFYIRASSDAIQTDRGGESIALKQWATRHIDVHASSDESILKQLRSEQAQKYNKQFLESCGLTKGKVDKFFKDKTHEYTDFPPDVQQKYIEWINTLPLYLRETTNIKGLVERDDIRYDMIDRACVLEYAYKDIEFTLT